MNNPFLDYLNLLGQIEDELKGLSELARMKVEIVRNSDLIALDEVIKQEQAAALTFRGLEQKQAPLLKSTGLEGVPLSDIADNFPPKMRAEAKEAVKRLQAQYQTYRKQADTARSLMESSLLQIEKFLADASPADLPAEGPGYQSREPEIPAPMKTDFRA